MPGDAKRTEVGGARAGLRALLFDLDGTLVETEILKARSYARAAMDLRPGAISEADVIAAYDDLVGRSREQVVASLTQRFALEEPARARMAELGVSSPSDVVTALRLRYYEAMLADRDLVRRQGYPEAIALLRRAKRDGYATGLATMSHAAQAQVLIDILGIRPELDVIVTRDDVACPKPDPEIYLLLARRLGREPAECLVIEDSVPGVRSALAAGMMCVAVSTALTRAALHATGVLPAERIVDDPARLAAVVFPLMTRRAQRSA
jgi:HAD superfamily hydrolase (TIGR01509 family)